MLDDCADVAKFNLSSYFLGPSAANPLSAKSILVAPASSCSSKYFLYAGSLDALKYSSQDVGP